MFILNCTSHVYQDISGAFFMGRLTGIAYSRAPIISTSFTPYIGETSSNWSGDHDFPATLYKRGREAIQKNYGELFKEISNLHCEFEKRIVTGNNIINSR